MHTLFYLIYILIVVSPPFLLVPLPHLPSDPTPIHSSFISVQERAEFPRIPAKHSTLSAYVLFEGACHWGWNLVPHTLCRWSPTELHTSSPKQATSHIRKSLHKRKENVFPFFLLAILFCKTGVVSQGCLT